VPHVVRLSNLIPMTGQATTNAGPQPGSRHARRTSAPYTAAWVRRSIPSLASSPET
jgi:hypothetical protein